MPVVEVEALDDTDLASAWARAVLAADAPLVAALEAEAADRGTTPQAAMVAAQRENRFSKTAEQTKKNIAEGNRWDTGQRTLKVKPGEKAKKKGAKTYGSDSDSAKGGKAGTKAKGDYVPARKKMGKKGGGRFTTPDDPEGTGGKGGGGGGGGGGKKTDADKEAEKAEKDAKALHKIEQDRVDAEDKAAREGNFGPLVSWHERMERIRKDQVAFAKTDEERTAAQADLDEATRQLADARDRQAKHKADVQAGKDTETATKKAAREADTAAKKTVREAESTAKKTATQQAKDAAQAAQDAAKAAQTEAQGRATQELYAQWEADLRTQYKDVPGVTEAELQDLIIRDRAKRARMLPK